MIVGYFDVFNAQREYRGVVQVAPDDGQVAAVRGALEGDRVAAFAVSFLEIGRENQADLRQRRHDGRRNGGDRVVEVLAQVLFRHRHCGKIGELASERNHFAAKTRSEFLHRHSGAICICGHPRGSIVSG